MTGGIDHLVLPVRDLATTAKRLQAMGFTTTPTAFHPWGTANILVQLQGNFLEFLTVADAAKIEDPAPGHFGFGAFNRDFLARREGFSMLVFESADAEADRRRYAERGLQGYPLFHFERQAKLPDGGSATVGFSLAFATDPRIPEAAFFRCQQHAPQFFWKPEYQNHDNGAQVCSAVFMSAATPEAYADFFSGLQGDEAVDRSDLGLEVTTARGQILVLSPAGLRARLPAAAEAEAMLRAGPPRFLGYQIATAKLERAKAILEQAGLAYRQQGASLLVGPAEGFGCFIEFVQAEGS